MKQLLLHLALLTVPVFSIVQSQVPNFGSCFNKENKRSISNKMDKFLTKISEETNCPKEKLTYTVDEFYTIFYSKACRHLPKKITVDICGEKRTYVHMGLSGNITHWLLGSWSQLNDK